MPIRVPVRRVAEEPLPGARLSPGTPDAGAFEAGVITTLGSQIAGVGALALQREEQVEKATAENQAKVLKDKAAFKGRRDKLRATNAINGFKDIWRNQRETYVNKFGLDADGQTTLADKDLEGYSKSLSDNAENDEQRALIAAKFAAFRETELNIIKGHEVDQFKISEDAENKANTVNIMREARLGHNDPITLFRLKLDLEDAIGEEVRGKGPEESEQITSTMTSLFHESVLNEKIPFNAENAQEYYDEHKTDILPEEREGIETLLKKEDTLQFAQQESDRIVATERDRSKWDDEARKVKDPEKRKVTEEHVARRKKQLDQEDVEAQEAELLYALEGIRNAPDLDASQIFIDGIKDPVDAATAQKVSDARFDLKKADIITDRTVQANVFDMIDKGVIKDPRQLIEFSSGLSTKDYDRLVTELRNKDNPDANTGVMSHPTAVKAFEASTKDKYDVTDDTQNADFNFLYERLDEAAKNKGDTLDYYEALKVADKVLVEGGIFGGGTFSDPNKTAAQAKIDGTFGSWLPKINTVADDKGKELADIKKGLRALGIVTDDERIFRFYKKETILREPLSKEHSELYDSLMRKSGFLRPVTR